MWSDHARFEAMRQVEVAACEELDGPTPDELDAIRAATFTVQAIDEREKVTDHDTAAFVDVLSASAGPAGRWIHHGLTSSDVLDTGLALQLRRVGEIVLPDSRAARRSARRRRPRARAHAVRRAHSRNPRRADDVRDQARGVRIRGESQRGPTRAGLRSGDGRRALGSRRDVLRDLARVRGARPRPPRSPPRAGLDPDCPARPPRRAARRDRARRRRLGAVRNRAAPPRPHRGRRGPRAVRARPEGLEFDAAQAQSDQVRAGRRPRARAPRERDGGVGGRGAVARARHLPLLGRARDPARLDDPARPPAAPGPGLVQAWSSTPSACARTSSSPTERCSPSVCCSRWWNRG